MVRIWDYDINELKKTEEGRILILERLINFGPQEGEKIPLKEVRKYWHRLKLFPKQRRLMELFLWKTPRYSPQTSKQYYQK